MTGGVRREAVPHGACVGPRRLDGRLRTPFLWVRSVLCPMALWVLLKFGPSGGPIGPIGSETPLRKDVIASSAPLGSSSASGLVRPRGLSDSCPASQRWGAGVGAGSLGQAAIPRTPPQQPGRWRRPAGFGFPHVFPIMWDGLKTAVAGPYLGVATTVRGSLLLSWLQWRPRACRITGGLWAVRVPARGPDDWGR